MRVKERGCVYVCVTEREREYVFVCVSNFVFENKRNKCSGTKLLKLFTPFSHKHEYVLVNVPLS